MGVLAILLKLVIRIFLMLLVIQLLIDGLLVRISNHAVVRRAELSVLGHGLIDLRCFRLAHGIDLRSTGLIGVRLGFNISLYVREDGTSCYSGGTCEENLQLFFILGVKLEVLMWVYVINLLGSGYLVQII